MAVRDVVQIDEELCDGCGLCVTACAEGAIAIEDGKARLISDVYCDGLGACLGECPQGAITVEQREAEPFDARAVEQLLAERGALAPAPAVMSVLGAAPAQGGGCPGSRAVTLPHVAEAGPGAGGPSALRHWPVQLHLVPPAAPFYRDADVLLAADCSAYAAGDFHGRFLRGRSLAIACPKLDVRQDVYVDKLVAMIDEARIRSLTVLVMEVPCCSGLLALARRAAAAAHRHVPLTAVTLSTMGKTLEERPVARA